jgi:alpha-mannosidase
VSFAISRPVHPLIQTSSGLTLKKAEIVNILEDPVEDLKIHSTEQSANSSEDEVHVKVDFRGYEVKTVRLILGRAEKRRGSSGGWVIM